jgi:hypothetical protein
MSGLEVIIGTIAVATTIGNAVTTGNNIKKFYKWMKKRGEKEEEKYERWQWIEQSEGDGGDFVKIEV